jgi:hypothetical protein
MSAEVVISLANPIIEDLQIWLQTSKEAFFKRVQTRIARAVVDQKLILLYLHVKVI